MKLNIFLRKVFFSCCGDLFMPGRSQNLRCCPINLHLYDLHNTENAIFKELELPWFFKLISGISISLLTLKVGARKKESSSSRKKELSSINLLVPSNRKLQIPCRWHLLIKRNTWISSDIAFAQGHLIKKFIIWHARKLLLNR